MPLALPSKLKKILEEVVHARHPELLDRILANDLETLTVQECHLLQEALGTELVETGLEKNDEPNDRGLEIEKLIDYLGAKIAD